MLLCGKAQEAQSRCSFPSLIRYGSLKVSSINAFLGCWNRDTGMIVAEELSLREWECFEHLARQREGNRISLPKLEQPSSGSKQREETHTLVLHLSLSLVVWISHSMEMVEVENLRLNFVANVCSLLHSEKM